MKNPIFTKKILATGIILSLFSSYIPVSYVGPNSVVFANSGTSVNDEVGVNFLDSDGRILSENDILQGGIDGQNMKVFLEVKIPEGSTNRTLELRLGNFLSFMDNNTTRGIDGAGATDEIVSKFTTISNIQNVPVLLTTRDGRNYHTLANKANYSINNQKITYTISNEVNSLRIPLILNADKNALLSGVSEDGNINGDNNYIEQSTPITTKLSYTKNGVNTENNYKLKNISINNSKKYSYAYVVPSYDSNTIDTVYASANNKSNYEADMRLVFLGGNEDSTLQNLYFDDIEADLVLPRGVSFVGFPEKPYDPNKTVIQNNYYNSFNWEKLSENTDSNGVTTVRIKMKSPMYGREENIIVRTKVDRSIITGDRYTYQVKNIKVKTRNSDEYLDLRIQNTKNTLTFLNSTHNIIEYQEGENLGLLNHYIPSVSTPITQSRVFFENLDGFWTGLGSFRAAFLRNYDNKETREKEMQFIFPENENFEVKGMHIVLVNNGYTLSTIKIRSKNNPELRDITLPKPLTYSSLQGNARFTDGRIDVRKLGLGDDDVLTEVIYPIGKIPGNHNQTTNGFYNANVFGLLKNKFNTNQVSTEMYLRDKDYDPADPERNYTTAKAGIGISANPAHIIDNISVILPNSKNINYGKREKISYELGTRNTNIGGNDNYGFNKIEKLHLVLPKDIEIKGFALKKNNVNFISEVNVTDRIEGENKIYTLDFSNVAGINRFLGYAVDKDAGLTKNFYTYLEVDLENRYNGDKEISLNQTLFIETDKNGASIGNSTLNGVDPYNLIENDKLLFTNKNNITNFLKLVKTDDISISVGGKLESENSFKNTSETFRIKNISEKLNLKFTVGNDLENEVGELEMYIPIPKKGQNWGDKSGNKAFDYGLTLDSLSSFSAGLGDIFDVTYGTVESSRLTGREITIDSLQNINFEANPANLENINLIKIKSKPGVKIPAKTSYDINSVFRLLNITEAEDGKSVSIYPFYKAIFSSHSLVTKADQISLQISLGKTAIEIYNDVNANGRKDTNETLIPNVTVEVIDEDGTSVETKTTTTGKVIFDSLVSGKSYTFYVTNPDKTRFHFTSGTALLDESKASKSLVAELREESALTLNNFGLSTAVSANPTINIVKTNSSEISGTGVANAKIEVTLPNGTKKQATVGNDRVWRISLTENEKASLVFDSTVRVNQKENLKKISTTVDKKVEKTDAEKNRLSLPTKTKVDDINTLTEDEKNKVKDEVRKANPTLNLDQISVDSQGNVTVTYADNSTNTLTKELTVIAKTDSEKATLAEPAKTKVDDINTLTENEKNKVKDEVKKANPSLNLDQISVDPQGNVTVTYADNSTKNLDKSKTVIQKTDSEKSTLNEPAKTKVDNINALTEDEKNKVKDEIKKANPSLNLDQTSVDSQGNVTVTYADNSTKNLDKSKTVIAKNEAEKNNVANPTDKVKVTDPNNLTEDEKNDVKNNVIAANPGINKNQISVDPQGNVTINYDDGSTNTINKNNTVTPKNEAEKNNVANPTDKVKVTDPNNLTEDEKNDVKNNVIAANPGINKNQISVDPQGNVTINYDDGSTNTINKNNTVTPKNEAEKNNVVNPTDKVKVTDPNNLTEDEKNDVKNNVIAANPGINKNQISVDPQGNVTVNYDDGSTNTINKNNTVTPKNEAEKNNVVNPTDKVKVTDPNNLTEDEKNDVKNNVIAANPGINKNQISVDPQGNVTINYDDGSTKNIDKSENVYTIPEVEVTGEKVRKIGENFDLTLTPRNGNITEVLGLPNGLKFENNKITGKNENLGKYKITIKLSDGNKDSEFEFEIEVTDLLKPSKTLVDHHYNLTDDEKDKVKNEIIKVNPFLTKDQIEVQNNGNTIIKFSDGTTKELPPYETIIQKFLGSAPKPEDLVLKDDPRVNTIITSIIEKTKDIIEKISENKNKEEVELNSAPEKTENKEKTINGETRKYSLNKEDTACPMIPNIVGDFNKEFELTFKDMVSIQNLDEVQRLTKVDILNKKGVNNTDLFEPNRGITRAEFLAIVLKAHCYDISVKPDSLPFYDVDLDSWQAKVVKVGVEEGIIKGYEADEKGVSFRPNRPISKIEAFAIMIKMREIKISDDIKDSYIDKKADWQKEPLATGEYLGILNPEKSNFKFYPDSILTRDEMVKYIVDIVRLY